MRETELDLLKRLAEIADRLSRLEGQHPQLLKMPDAAKRLGIGMTLLKELVRNGEVQTVSLGKREMVPSTEIARLCTPSGQPNVASARERKKARPRALIQQMDVELAKLDAVAKRRRKVRR